jgi:hypothetical protein
MSRRSIATVAAFIGMVAALAYLFFGDTAIRQTWQLPMAERHLPTVRKVLKDRPEFENVDAGVNTGGGGIILVIGRVRTREDLASLMNDVANTQPPVKVKYMVKIDNAEMPGQQPVPTSGQ